MSKARTSLEAIEIEGDIPVEETEQHKRDTWLADLAGRLHVSVAGRKPIVDNSWRIKDYERPPLCGTELIVDVAVGTGSPFMIRIYQSMEIAEENAVGANLIYIQPKQKSIRMQDPHREITVYWDKLKHIPNLPRPKDHWGGALFQRTFIDYPRRVTGSHAKAFFKGDYHWLLSAISSPTNIQVLNTMIGMAVPVWERPDIYTYIEDMGLGNEPLSKLRDVELAYRASQDALTALTKLFSHSTVTEIMRDWYEQD